MAEYKQYITQAQENGAVMISEGSTKKEIITYYKYNLV